VPSRSLLVASKQGCTFNTQIREVYVIQDYREFGIHMGLEEDAIEAATHSIGYWICSSLLGQYESRSLL
jgi:hypothetical protein